MGGENTGDDVNEGYSFDEAGLSPEAESSALSGLAAQETPHSDESDVESDLTGQPRTEIDGADEKGVADSATSKTADIAGEEVPNLDQLDSGPETLSSPLLTLFRQAQPTVQQLRTFHDELFGAPPSDREALATLLQTVEPTVEKLLNEYHQALPKIVGTPEAALPNEIFANLHAQALHLQEAEVRMTALDLRGDFSSTVKEIQAECSHLVAAVHGFRDALEAAYACDLALRSPLPERNSPVCHDPLTGMVNRVGIEVFFAPPALARLARDGLVSVLFDIDHFGKINQRFGHRRGDLILAAIAKSLRESPTRHALWARYGGDQFLLLLANFDSRWGTQEAERIRQQFEMTRFTIGGEAVEMTFSVAVTVLQNDDTPSQMFARLLETLTEAKRAGGNRTFLHDGKSPAPVMPLNLHIEERIYPVGSTDSAAETEEVADPTSSTH